VPADAKIARLMALAAMKDMEDNIEKALFLRSAGFVNIEIAAILNIHDGQVRTALMRGTKRKRRSSR
jgi:orotate phosphoribosyltransferase-like protein